MVSGTTELRLAAIVSFVFASAIAVHAERGDTIEQPPLYLPFTGQCGFEDMRVLTDTCFFDSRVDLVENDVFGCQAEVAAPVSTGVIPLTGTGGASGRPIGGVEWGMSVHSRSEYAASYDLRVTVDAACTPPAESGDCTVVGIAIGVATPLECLERAAISELEGLSAPMGNPKSGLEATCKALREALPSLDHDTHAREVVGQAMLHCYQVED